MSFDNNEQTKAEINFKRLLFFLYRVLPLTKFYWSYLAFEIGGVGKGACTAYAIFSEYLLLEHTVKHL